MENNAKTSYPMVEGQKTGHLSPVSTNIETPGNSSSRLRSSSIAPSIRSNITIVDTHSNVPVLDKKAIKRRRTQIAEVKISRWSCFLGLFFGPRITERAALATMTVPDIKEEDGEEIFDRNACPWIQTVHVLPSEKSGTKVHQQARCMFDTGCIQGNLVSREFALELGFTESDFGPLSSRERNGGTSTTGHAHMPVGALHLTWYHNTSPRLYKDMRFLVSPSQDYQLVIGARSILLHKLISYPNFGCVVSFKPQSDPELDKLRQAEAKLKNDLETLEHKRDQEKGNQDQVKKLDKKIEKKEKLLAIKTAEHELYIAKKHADEDPTSKIKKQMVEDRKHDLESARGGPARDDNTVDPQDIPHVKVSEPDRTTTGFSTHSVDRSRARKRES